MFEINEQNCLVASFICQVFKSLDGSQIHLPLSACYCIMIHIDRKDAHDNSISESFLSSISSNQSAVLEGLCWCYSALAQVVTSTWRTTQIKFSS